MNLTPVYGEVHHAQGAYTNVLNTLQRSMQQVDAGARSIAQGNITPGAVTQLIGNSYSFKAGVLLLQRNDEMAGKLFQAYA